MNTTLSPIERIDQNARRSRAVATPTQVFLAGQVADDKSLDIVGQAQQVFAKIDQLLAQAGTDKTRVLSVTIWLASMHDYEAFNTAWDRWIVPGQAPARCCCAVMLADPGYKVELIATALRG